MLKSSITYELCNRLRKMISYKIVLSHTHYGHNYTSIKILSYVHKTKIIQLMIKFKCEILLT